MRLPDFITFTGADDRTCVNWMRNIATKYPVEWGVLFSPSRQGVDQRYPGGDKQSELAWSGLRLAAHLCGGHARYVMGEGEKTRIPVDLGYWQRVQVNHVAPDGRCIARFCHSWGTKGIAQARGDTFPADASVEWLYDRSGGNGVAPKTWPKHPGRGRVGYAGGINPDNVLDVLRAINCDGPYWIDMETGVRDAADWFDLDKVQRVCELVYGAATGDSND
ncbi:MAG: hypothetical protein BGP24_14885 [Lysobacterales bacterium 69-70]|nr:hypothetical protein [Xanthomonadaceae bacterium]ODU35369.1 MAG: hypothetical protein ABS97_05710 [Xanthomonadaceae bacterium SCN 69-320]ODV16866.1 MAG: hypothetical protein ABT27_19005 [Xanthomonadaceae bacterium SCN 69-25]OJY94264.1 MAG: hypothetical protein BGP24_14885 [Xanthomonadales bacterium 69-70]